MEQKRQSQCERFMPRLGMKLWDENDQEEVMKQEGNYFISMSPVGTSSNTKKVYILHDEKRDTKNVEKIFQATNIKHS